MKQTIEETLNEEKVIDFDPFAKKISRADITYTPLCKDLKDVMYVGDLSKKENRENLIGVLKNY